MNRSLNFLALAGLLAAPSSAQSTVSPVTYKELGSWCMRAQTMPETTKQLKPLHAHVETSIPEISPYQKLQKLFALYTQAESQIDTAAGILMDTSVRTVLKDLDLFYGQGADYAQHVFGRLNMTKTTFGHVGLAHMLSHPTNDVQLLQQRQMLVNELLTNDPLFNQIDALLERVAQSESAVFSLYAEENKPTKTAIEGLYFDSALTRNFNANPVALECNIRLKDFGAAALMAVPSLVPGYISYQGIKADAFKSYAWPTIKQYYDPRTYTKFCDSTNKGVLLYAAIHGLQVYIAKMGYDRAHATHSLLVYLQSRLIGLATCVDVVHSIHALSVATPALTYGLTTYAIVENVASGSFGSPTAQQLIGLLDTNTFKGQASTLSFAGRILAANTCMARSQQELLPIFQMLGELDACFSIAKLLKKYAHERVGYTLVTYSYVYDAAQPYVYMEDFWNPMVDPKVAVPNSVGLGNPGRNMILTGANTGGKSTILKALLINMLLAHTLGIAAADTMTLTPFVYLGSSLNIADDTAAGDSLYQAEVKRAQELVRTGRQLKDKQYAFVVIDELFRGTSPEKAQEGTYLCAQELIAAPNMMFILATHFTESITKLEQETNGGCTNYKIEIHKDADGNLIRPFKLERGVNTTNVATDILQDALNT
ncbi:MAG: hypothetical protein ACHQVS_02225 [Candidatus Babeliales bacterium]